ncbi:MAG TPA: hypothetical protein ENH34_01420 [Phycisphaerales bacterium]|nr:hypothetical protein [Phycisphaerales bacterium]
MRRKRQIEPESAKVPAYIVTFSDMVTLLLTFFVMLLSLATVQDEELFNKGRESFLKSMRQLGLGVLYGGMKEPDFGNVKIKYFISSSDELSKGRTIDAKEEEIRWVFSKISRSMTTMPSQIVAKKNSFSMTNIRFSPDDATLNASAKRFLTQFVLDLQQNPGSKTVKLYVLGLTGEGSGFAESGKAGPGGAAEKEQWILSARRAWAVADYLQNILPSGLKWPVYSWGAGPGGDWVSRDSPISRQSQILIAVLRAND